MAEEDDEKTGFYTDQGKFCYTKMPFGLKNVDETYQILADSAFQSQIGRNLEAYVDDVVIKSNDEKMLLADIVETFDNLRMINMKLNPKKRSFGIEEGNFLGYMVSKGYGQIRRRQKRQSDAFFWIPVKIAEKDTIESWTLFTDRASNKKGFRAGDEEEEEEDGEHPPAIYPRIFGHEAMGVVESVGEGVHELVEGDTVIPIFLPDCEDTSRFTDMNGETVYHFLSVSSFSEYTVVDIAHLTKIDPSIPPNRACLLRCGIST
ncbi:alcohol dehydrogenase-like 7 protein, partial [Tanacetum coccineum]